MSRTYLIVAVGPHQQQMTCARYVDEMLQQGQRCGIQPLQIVEKQYQRSLGSSEHTDKPIEHSVKSILCVLRGQVENRGLRSDQKLEFRNQLDHQLGVGPQGLQQLPPQRLDFGIAPAKDIADKVPERLRESCKGDVLLVLVKFSSGEETTCR